MLEQIAYQLPRISETKQRVYQTKDLEKLSATALHYGEGGGSSGFVGGSFGGINKKDMDDFGIVSGKIEPLANGGITIPYGNLGIPKLKDLHDTFNVDRYGNLYSGHTTFDNKFHINIDSLKSGKDIFKK